MMVTSGGEEKEGDTVKRGCKIIGGDVKCSCSVLFFKIGGRESVFLNIF